MTAAITTYFENYGVLCTGQSIRLQVHNAQLKTLHTSVHHKCQAKALEEIHNVAQYTATTQTAVSRDRRAGFLPTARRQWRQLVSPW